MTQTKIDKKILTFKVGQKIIQEGNSDRKMYIVQKGQVRVYKMYFDTKITLAILSEGEIFGELSFFDARPRSASVDALTNVKVIVLDGKASQDQIKNLPPWIHSIFKTVFNRFREIDLKLTSLQNMTNFKKNSKNNENFAKNIYIDVKKIISPIKIAFSNTTSILEDQLYSNIQELIKNDEIPLQLFFSKLIEANILIKENDKVCLVPEELDKFEYFVDKEISSKRFIIFDYSTIALLRYIISIIPSEIQSLNDEIDINQFLPKNPSVSLPFFDEAVINLKNYQLCNTLPFKLNLSQYELISLYKYQNILKSFDYSFLN